MSDSDILARLAELDQKARALVEDAQAALDETASSIDSQTEQLRRSSAEKSAQRIDAIRREEEAASQARLEELSQQYRTRTEALEKTYQERHAQWEDEIFRRCVGE